ncbi:hypothetical protein DSECCO2_477790 [anaerobic digester metagenome]
MDICCRVLQIVNVRFYCHVLPLLISELMKAANHRHRDKSGDDEIVKLLVAVILDIYTFAGMSLSINIPIDSLLVSVVRIRLFHAPPPRSAFPACSTILND